MLEFLGAIWDFVWQQLGSIWILYTTSSVLAGFLALSILDRIFHVFDILKR